MKNLVQRALLLLLFDLNCFVTGGRSDISTLSRVEGNFP